MASANNSEPLEAYLREVRARLRGLPQEDVAEILQELRSHVFDAVAGDLSDAAVARALAKLGEPREIARINLGMRVAAQSLGSRSPLAILRGIVRLAGLSARGFVALMISLIGYGLAASWFLTALVKPFLPERAGLWQLPDAAGDLSLSLGVHGPGFKGHDLLGWWIVPLGLLLGLGFAYLTYRYDVRALRRMAQRRAGGAA